MHTTKVQILELIKNDKLKLRPNQNRISLPIINRIFKKMSNNIAFSSIKVSEGLIIDGHHRYISSHLADFDIEVIYGYPSPSKPNDYKWSDVQIMEEDWDTEVKIKVLNEEDARYNNLTIEDIIEMIK